MVILSFGLPLMMSPSSRRAWIEIWYALVKSYLSDVALLTEGVD